MQDEDVYRLRKQMKAFDRRWQRELSASDGLSLSAFHLLVALRQARIPLGPSQLAQEVHMKDSNVAAALRLLEGKRLVSRRSNPSDGRRAFVELTPAGLALVEKAIQQRYAWLHKAIEAVLDPEEQRVLLMAGDLMQRLAEHEGFGARHF